MHDFLQDLRFGMRTLLRSRGLAVISVVTLALGIGANTAVFSVVNTVLMRPLPYPDPDQLVGFGESQPNLNEAPLTPANFLDFQTQNTSFAQVTALRHLSFNLTGLGPAERITGIVASPNVFSMFGVQPILGRPFLPSEGAFGVPRVALLTFGFWQSYFGGDTGVVGRNIILDSQPVKIVGVLPANFRYGRNTKIWVNPVNIVPEVFSASADWERKLSTNREIHYLAVIGRLKPHVTVSQAQTDANRVMDGIHQLYPVTAGHKVRLFPLAEASAGPVRQTLLVLLGVVGLVLLIACANIANLLLARALARRRELAVRTALGASKLRVVRQLLTESILLALAGGIAGVALAWGLVRLLVTISPRDLPRVEEVSLHPGVLLFTVAISLLTGLLFGLAPAFAATRQSPGAFLKEGGRGSTSGLAHNRLRGFLIIGEVALSLVLLVSAGLLLRSFIRLLEVAPGFNPDRIVTMWVNFTSAAYLEKGSSTRLLDELLPRVAALPGVESVAISSDLPLEGDDTTTGIGTVDGRQMFERGHQPLMGVHAVNSGYFRSMGIPLLRGRELNSSDNAESRHVVIVNQKLAELVWPGQDPLGRHLNILDDKPAEVVGVVGDVLHNGLTEAAGPETYYPFAQNPWSYVTLAVRSRGNPSALYTAIRAVVAELDAELPVHDMRPMEQVVAETVSTRRLTLGLVGAFGGIALVLAVVGIFGVMSYAVTERIHEIGVRMALGAQRRDVLRLVVGKGMCLAAAGLALGVVVALAATRLIAGLLFGIRPSDPVTYSLICVLLGFAAFAACYVPARRATAVDPLVALRYE